VPAFTELLFCPFFKQNYKILLQLLPRRPIKRIKICRFQNIFIITGPQTLEKCTRQLVLNKGGEKYIFRYENGCEDDLLDVLIKQAQESRTDFDWFDAAVLSFKLTQSLVLEAERLLQTGTPLQIGALPD